MQVQLGLNNQNFNGNVIVSGLSEKQQKIYKKIEPVVTDMFKDKNYDLFISGNAEPDLECIHIDYRIPPRYVNFFTRNNKSRLNPSAEALSGSFDHGVWLKHIERLVQRHEQSPDYVVEIPRVQKIKNFIKNVFNKN